MKLDKHDIRTLKALNPIHWQFVAWKDSERCRRMTEGGLLEEELQLYKRTMRIGPDRGSDVVFRQAFRLTDAGREKIKELACETPP